MKVVNPRNVLTIHKVAELCRNSKLAIEASKVIWSRFHEIEYDFKRLHAKDVCSIMSVKGREVVSNLLRNSINQNA